MGLFDGFKFKKGKKSEKQFSGKKKNELKSSENVLDLVKEDSQVSEKPKQPVTLKSATGRAFHVLIRPEFSEKARMLSHQGKYVFVVHNKANKPEVKKAVEKVYDVHVSDVNILNFSGKMRRYGRATGRTRSWKKAVVSLRAGEKIEGLIDNI